MSFVAAAIGGSALIGAGASIYSANLQAGAAKSAANAQVSAEQQALALQREQLGKLDPWLNVGSGANYTLGSLYGIGPNGQPANAPQDFSKFFSSPDYQFALQQGNAGLVNYENAMGLGKSGSGLAAASTFNQGLATQQFGNYFNRLMGLSQLGATAANTAVGGGNAAAGTIGNIGASQAGGIIGGANAWAGGLSGAAGAGSGAANALLLQSLLSKNTPASAAAASPSAYQWGTPTAPYSPTPWG
jgi:hypothetical protein